MRGDFLLSSGIKSNFYLDLRKVTLTSESLFYITYIFLNKILKLDNKIDFIGGPELSAVPLISSIINYGYLLNFSFDGFIIRNERKEYGTNKLIEGIIKEKSDIIIVDDIITSGDSIFNSIEKLKHLDCNIKLIMSIVSRGSGVDKLKSKGYNVFSIFNYKEIISG